MYFPTMYALESENKNAKLFNCVQVRFLSYSLFEYEEKLPKEKENTRKYLEIHFPSLLTFH